MAPSTALYCYSPVVIPVFSPHLPFAISGIREGTGARRSVSGWQWGARPLGLTPPLCAGGFSWLAALWSVRICWDMQSLFCLTFGSQNSLLSHEEKRHGLFKSWVTLVLQPIGLEKGKKWSWLQYKWSSLSERLWCQRECCQARSSKQSEKQSTHLTVLLRGCLIPALRGNLLVPGLCLRGRMHLPCMCWLKLLVFFLRYNWEKQGVVSDISVFLKTTKGLKVASQIWKAFGFSDWPLHPLAGCRAADDNCLWKWS